MQNLLIATTNKGKVREFENLLAEFPINLRSLSEFEKITEVEETGNTFAENAKLKAIYYAKKTKCWALADDSGLEVEALKNAPGVYSARYAGENSSDEENIKKLLLELEKSEDNLRIARFICEMAISDENGKLIYISKGKCEGVISHKPCGSNGFGYDQIFIPKGYDKTFGELSNEIKQAISHRSKALKEITDHLSQIPKS